MRGFIIRRILIAIPTLLGRTIIVFLMLRITTPGDPAELLLRERATPLALDAIFMTAAPWPAKTEVSV